jgi:AbrB family looped-hinge helix DNA binding protein
MEPRSARLDRRGRLALPASIRRDLELRDGDEVVFTAGETAGEVRLTSRRAAVEHAQALIRRHIPAQVRLVDALMADRRSEAAHESEDPARLEPRE